MFFPVRKGAKRAVRIKWFVSRLFLGCKDSRSCLLVCGRFGRVGSLSAEGLVRPLNLDLPAKRLSSRSRQYKAEKAGGRKNVILVKDCGKS